MAKKMVMPSGYPEYVGIGRAIWENIFMESFDSTYREVKTRALRANYLSFFLLRFAR